MNPRRRPPWLDAPELLELRVLAVTIDTLLVSLRIQHPTLDELSEPTAPPTLRAARDLAARARTFRAAMRSYRASLRRALRHPLEDDIPF